MQLKFKKHVFLSLAAAAVIGPMQSAIYAGTSVNPSATQQGLNVPAITISASGQTALRNFTAFPGITTLPSNGSITLNYSYLGGGTTTFYASNSASGNVQLAKKDFTTADFGVGATSVLNATTTQGHSAIRFEWHEQGSVQGQIDLLNDQVGYVTTDGGVTGYLSNLSSRGPSTGNPTWINSGSFTGAGNFNGHSLSGGNFANTYDTNVYDLATGRNKSSGSFGGVNGQDRIQFAIGEYKTEGLSRPGTGSVFASPGASGYGKGNPALNPTANTIGIGVAGARQQLFSESIANLSTDKVDPQSTSSAHYASGPWNTAGANNIDSKQIAVTAVTISANPGSGLSRINKGDGQWLQAAGRLQNGAEFNVVTRANDAGQRIVPAVNFGIDPSWAVGENDNGNTSGTALQNEQKTLGDNIRYSGKTGGTESRNAIAQSRLGVGPLSLAEARGAASNAPVRALDIDWEHLTDTGNASDFKRATFDNIVNFTYKGVLISHYNTVKQARPDFLANYLSDNPSATPEQVQTWWNNLTSEQTGIKGDPYGNVRAFINNVSSSLGTAAAGGTFNSVNNPADALFVAGFLVPGLLNYSREYDGGPLTPTNLNAAQLAIQADVKANYGPLFSPDNSSGSNAQTIGAGAYYGALNAATVILNGATVSSARNEISNGTASLAITSKDASGALLPNGTAGPKGNYLFGNFNQDGRRDFASVKESLNAALSLRHVDKDATNAFGNSSIYLAAGGTYNSTVVPSLSGTPGWASTANTKGDLIILSDFDSDGDFDGKDVYLLARGQSLSDNGSTDHLTTASGATFADQIRNPNAKLNKNAALDYINAALNNPSDPDQLFIRKTARANAVNDPNGVNAFNKFDVNRDGLISRKDASIVDKFAGKNFHSLDDSLAATIAIDGSVNPALAQTPISLVDVELTDDGAINNISASSDFGLIRTALGSALLDGDADFSGAVDSIDFTALLSGYGANGQKWSSGDFTLDGKVSTIDFNLLAGNFGLSAAAIPAPSLGSVVPEPASIALLALSGLSLVRRRR